MSWISSSCEEPASRLTSSIVSLQVEQPALKISIFFFVLMMLFKRSFDWVHCLSDSSRDRLPRSRMSRGGAHAFQIDAITNSPTALYMVGLDSHTNFPSRTLAAATNP